MWSAEKIKQIRLKVMMSQQEFATSVGVGVTSVIRWEKGEFTPTFKAQRKLAEFCGVHGINIEGDK